MSAVAGETARTVSAEVTRRWHAIDPLLPDQVPPARDCGAELIVAGAGRQPAAIGTCEHWEGAAGSLDLTWGATRRFQLTAQMAGPGVASALGQLLSQWRNHLASVLGADGEDTATVVTWPSRDIDGVKALLRHGLAPLTVIAARQAGRPPAGPADGAASRAVGSAGDAARPAGTAGQDVRIRRAELADIDTVVRLGVEVIRFDAHFGTVIERPSTADALQREAAGSLARPDAWTWLAERDGMPIGLLYAQRPDSAGWIAPMVHPSPVAYLELMGVVPGERGRGVGAALVSRYHREVDAAGVAVTLLHYEKLNPLSGPFWSRQGYRPLWTVWEARPACTLR